jgi:hypothetical protein
VHWFDSGRGHCIAKSLEIAGCAYCQNSQWSNRATSATMNRASHQRLLRDCDHNVLPRPRAAAPHFHAVYGEHQAQIVIATLEPLVGEFPARALRLVREWAELHRAELQANWEKARARQPLDTIAPLP